MVGSRVAVATVVAEALATVACHPHPKDQGSTLALSALEKTSDALRVTTIVLRRGNDPCVAQSNWTWTKRTKDRVSCIVQVVC